ncbi:MAG: glycosyl hydrolase family 28 protein [Armatimonadota bacterium]
MAEIEIKPEPGHGRFVVYASRYAKLDSNVIDGGGTDDTEILQAILDKAPEWGGLHLIMDGAALVSGLEVHSDTTIECENKSCGFFLASGMNRSIIQNAHLDFEIIHDKNITLLGGTYNHNAAGQEHDLDLKTGDVSAFDRKYPMAIEFYGVEHLTMKDLTVRNQRTYAMHIINWFKVTMENITIELPNNMYAQNQDGIHFMGPGQFLSMKNIVGCSGDDFIALTPDERDSVSDITDVTIDGVFLNDADQGIRLLSRGTGTLDRVVIKNVMGTFKSCGFFCNAWYPGSGGNFGDVTFENIDLRQANHKYQFVNPFLFRIGGNWKSLTLRDIHHQDAGDPSTYALVEVGIPFGSDVNGENGQDFKVDRLTIDGMQIKESVGHATESPYIQVFGKIGSMVIKDVQVEREPGTPAGSCLIGTREYTDIGKIHISGATVDRLETLIRHDEGRIGTVCMNDILADNTSGKLITGDAEITRVYKDSIHGAE